VKLVLIEISVLPERVADHVSYGNMVHGLAPISFSLRISLSREKSSGNRKCVKTLYRSSAFFVIAHCLHRGGWNPPALLALLKIALTTGTAE